MTGKLRRLRLKRFLNGLYAWGIHLFHLCMDLLPAALRALFWRLLLGRCGRGVLIDHRVYFKYPWLIFVGDDVSINRGAEFYPGLMEKASIRIGSGVRIAPNVRIHAAGHDPDHVDLIDTAASVVVEDNVWLGAASTILPGVTIGRDAVVAAGAVVTRDVAPGSIVAGVPARYVRMRRLSGA